jgi:putative ABC transport system ATP-binding protein
MVTNPSLILADEPTGNLDEDTGAKVMELLFRMQAEDRATLVLVTHDRGLAARCGRVAAMHSGRMEAR